MAQVEKTLFVKALEELGHNPSKYAGQRLTIEGMSELYELDTELIVDAIDKKVIAAHYGYKNDGIWIDGLEAAYFYFCTRNEAHLYSANGVTD